MPCSRFASERAPAPTQSPSASAFEMRHVVGDDGEAVREAGDLDAHQPRLLGRGDSRLDRLLDGAEVGGKSRGSISFRGRGSARAHSGSSGRGAGRRFDGVGKFRRVRGRQRHHRRSCRDDARATADADGGVRIDQSAVVMRRARAIVAAVVGLVGAPDAKSRASIARAASASVKAPDCARPAIRRRTAAASRSSASKSSRSKFDETWMSIDGEVVAVTPRTS